MPGPEHDRKPLSIKKEESLTVSDAIDIVVVTVTSPGREPNDYEYNLDKPLANIVIESTELSGVRLTPQEIETLTIEFQRSKEFMAGTKFNLELPGGLGKIGFEKKPQRELTTVTKTKYTKTEK